MMKEMDKVNKNGQMDLDTKEIGEMEKLTVMVNCITLMETFMKVSGQMIRLMETELIPTLTERNLQGNGEMTSNMDKVLKHGLMEPSMMDNILKERKTVVAS